MKWEKGKRKFSDYSEAEIFRFKEMHQILTAYNLSLGTSNELPLPNYSDDEMAAYSVYREILISDTY